MKISLPSALVGLGAALVASTIVLQSGVISFAADEPHTPLVTDAIAWIRERSIAKCVREIAVPTDLSSAERIRRGAGNYAAMCASCHLVPGETDSEIHKGLYPKPPNLTQADQPADPAVSAAARRFWIIKHGIKGSGMPAWSLGGMGDDAIWDLTAFLNRLVGLDAQSYQQMVASSDGHSHEGMHHAADEPQKPVAKPNTVKPHTHKAGDHSHAH